MPEYDSAIRTRTLARIVGPYMVVLSGALFVRRETLAMLLPSFMQDAPLIFVSGACVLIAGLAMLAAHHHWTSPSACAITLIGAGAALKGALLMIAPNLGSGLTAAVTHTPAVLPAASAGALLLGLWLSAVGWKASPPLT